MRARYYRSYNTYSQGRPLWCPNQEHLPSLKSIYRVANLTHYVLLGYLGLRWIVKSVH